MQIPTVTSGEGLPNPPGLRMQLHLIARAGLTATPDNHPFDRSQPGKSIIMNGDFQYRSNDDHFMVIPIVVDSGALVDNLLGEIGGQAFTNELEFFMARTDADKLEFAQNFANAYVVAGIRDRQNKMRIVGRHDDPAYIMELNVNGGKTAGDRAGGTYKLKCGTGFVAPIFEGTLRIEPVE